MAAGTCEEIGRSVMRRPWVSEECKVNFDMRPGPIVAYRLPHLTAYPLIHFRRRHRLACYKPWWISLMSTRSL